MKFLRKIEREFYRIKAQIFLPKEKRKEYVDGKIKKQEAAVFEKEAGKHLFGVSYSVFDGEELLEKSVESIRSQVDYINVVWQDVSWKGAAGNKEVPILLERLKSEGKIDEIIKFTPDISIKAARNEERKRNIGLEAAKKFGCDYFMTMDCDEFYLEDEVREAKQFILKHGVTHSFCGFVNYGPLPTERFIDPSSYAVQFFSKINGKSYLGVEKGRNKNRIAEVDQTRELSDFAGAKYYFLTHIHMHHMTLVRKDLYKKFMNTSCADFKYVTKEQIDELLKKIGERTAVPNVFDIRI